ncbi:hypothetical protein L6270_04055 [Candidatus Parcubacteria bacterium]|nr:hypothetical protein [Patescibacteria group bacterium]MBU4309137.1 hypothetical protein [Patescibacteria group bacterium]MBU4432176.1 hypothetical protein [Patescibacteria group bacterium]MBU4577498.1 hypothetical protein [Patescibacteria group bacterium]MCG2697185.1 hypothetical protein [Candidatus Parcubacteria bacterium]
MTLSLNTKTKTIFLELFYVLTASLLIFAILEAVWPRVVLAYINISKVLILWMIIAIILLMLPKKKQI